LFVALHLEIAGRQNNNDITHTFIGVTGQLVSSTIPEEMKAEYHKQTLRSEPLSIDYGGGTL
jgi:hypothetical protein